MKPTISTVGARLPWLLLLACGPTITLEPSGTSGDDGSGGASSPPTTGSMTTTAVPPSTGGTAADGGTEALDTGGPRLDLPEDCGIIEQDCPSGYKCMPYTSDGGGTWNDTRCVPVVDEPAGVGEPCTVEDSWLSGLDDCDATSMCWHIDRETNMGTCLPFCIGTERDPGCADPCSWCTVHSDGFARLCYQHCDPILQDCPEGWACYAVDGNLVCAPDASSVDGNLGDPCGAINGCSPGLFCLDADDVPGCEGATGCCAPVCPLGEEDPCPGLLPGTVCTPWFSDGLPIPGACLVAEPGVCMLPS